MKIDSAIRKSLENGYDVHLIFSKNTSMQFTYKLVKDGNAVGKGIRVSDYKNPDCAILTGGPLDIVADSILETLKREGMESVA